MTTHPIRYTPAVALDTTTITGATFAARRPGRLTIGDLDLSDAVIEGSVHVETPCYPGTSRQYAKVTLTVVTDDFVQGDPGDPQIEIYPLGNHPFGDHL